MQFQKLYVRENLRDGNEWLKLKTGRGSDKQSENAYSITRQSYTTKLRIFDND